MLRGKGRRLIAATLLGWGAVVLTASAGGAQTAGETPAPPAEAAPPATTPQAPAPEPEKPGKGFCDRSNPILETTCNVAKNLGPGGNVLEIPGDVVGGVAAPVVEAVQEGFAESITRWVGDGASFFLDKVGGIIDATTAPKLDADWFKGHYRAMAALAAVLLIPVLFMSVIGAVIHQDGGRLLRMIFGNLPMATLLTAAGVALVTVGLTITDEMSVWVSQGAGADAGEGLARAGLALQAIPGPGSLFATFIGGLLLIFGTVAVWFELLLRSAAIYIAVLFLPIALAGLVWPATAHWAKRLTHLLVALVLSKFVIVAILSLGASGLAASTSADGYGAVIAGAALLGLAALSPLALLKMIPMLESGSASMAAAGRNPTPATTARNAGSSLFDQAQQRLAREKAGHNPMAAWHKPPRPSATGGTTGGAAGGAKTATAAGGVGAGVADAGIAVGQAGARRARQSAEGLPHLGGASPSSGNGSTTGNGSSNDNGTRAGGAPPPPAPPSRRFDELNGDNGHGDKN